MSSRGAFKLRTKQDFFFYSPLAFFHAAIKDILVEKSSFTLVAVQTYNRVARV